MSGRPGRNDAAKPCNLAARLIAKLGRPIIRHLSELARESLERPGSWRCLEIVYRNEPHTLLDRFFLGSRSARGARYRLQVLWEEIRACVEQRRRVSNSVTVVSFGSGPGHESLGCLDGLLASTRAQATCIDRDASALEHGRALAARQGLSNCVQYRQGNVLRMEAGIGRYDIGVLSGLLDYFDFDTAVSVLRAVWEQIVPGGIVLVANMRRHYLASTMRVLGNWHLVYREPEEMERILKESGFEGIKVWLEPAEVFCIGKATRPC